MTPIDHVWQFLSGIVLLVLAISVFFVGAFFVEMFQQLRQGIARAFKNGRSAK